MNKSKYDRFILSPNKRFPVPPVFGLVTDLSRGFSSLYAVTEEAAAAIAAAGTAAGFKGIVWSERLWIDVDSYAAADVIEGKLREMGLDFIAYDTGNRGAHFGISRLCEPSHLLPAQDKKWVREQFGDLADLSIYTHLHLFRLPGTKHEGSGREKVLVHTVPGKQLVHEAWDTRVGAYGQTSDAPMMLEAEKSIFQCYRVMVNSKPTKIGDRHPTFTKLVYALRDDAKVSPAFARAWLGEVNKMADEPHADEHLDQLIRSIYG